MKVRLECSVCGKIHKVDLRHLPDIFSCDACSSEGEVPEREKIDLYEKAMKRSHMMGLFSGIFAVAAFISYFFWMDIFTLNPASQAMHETAEIIMYSCGGLCFIFGMLEGFFNREIYF